jgi:hypothetical protein
MWRSSFIPLLGSDRIGIVTRHIQPQDREHNDIMRSILQVWISWIKVFEADVPESLYGDISLQ